MTTSEQKCLKSNYFHFTFQQAQKLFYVIAFLLLANSIHAQCPIEDILGKYAAAGLTASSSPSNSVLAGDYLYFTADDGNHGEELWMYDFNTDAASFIDILTVSTSFSFSRLENLLLANNRIFFQVVGGGINDLYSVPVGTLDTASISFSSTINFNNSYVYDNKIYFSGPTEDKGYELYLMDIETMNFEILDINEGAIGSNPHDFLGVDGKLYFIAYTPNQGTELYLMDVATKELSMLDISAGEESSNPVISLLANNKLYFTATTPNQGTELYMITAGSITDTMSVDINVGEESAFGSYKSFIHAGNAIYFRAIDANRGSELWKIPAGTLDTAMIDIASGSLNSNPNSFFKTDSKLYFSAVNNTIGRELWAVPLGTLDTVPIDLYAGTSSSNPTSFYEAGGSVYFSATAPLDENSTEDRLFSISNETAEVASIDLTTSIDAISLSNSALLGDELYFSSRTGGPNREGINSIWSIKAGTANDTTSIHLDGLMSRSLTVRFVGVKGDDLVFTHQHRRFGLELFTYNRITQKVTIVEDVNTTTPATMLSNFVQAGNFLYFSGLDYTNGRELWMLNLTTEKLTCVDINAGEGDSAPGELTIIENSLYFTANDGKRGKEVWKVTLGTLDTTMIDINPGFGGSIGEYDQVYFTKSGGKTYFVANDGQRGQELYMVTTGMLDTLSVDIRPGDQYSSSPEKFIELDGQLYFTAIVDSTNRSIFDRKLLSVTAGSLDVQIVEGTNKVRNPFSAGNYIYFEQPDEAEEESLYYLEKGTMNAVKLNLNEGDSFDFFFNSSGVYVGGRLFFLVNSATEGNEIYVTTPGSDTFTPIIINSGTESALGRINYFDVLSESNNYYFQATDAEGSGVFVIKAGETTAEKIIEGITSIGLLTKSADKFYISAFTRSGDTKRHIWAIDMNTNEVEELYSHSTQSIATYYRGLIIGDILYTQSQVGGLQSSGNLLSIDLKTKEAKIHDTNEGLFDSAPSDFFEHNGTLFYNNEKTLKGGDILYKLIPFEAGIDSEKVVKDGDEINLADLVEGIEAGGAWSRVDGTGGSFNAMMGSVAIDADFVTSNFQYINNGACLTPDTATVKLLLSCSTVNAGVDTTVCNNSYTLQGSTLQTGETGQWTFVTNPNDAGTLTNLTSSTAMVNTNFSTTDIFEGNSNNSRTVTLQWKVTSDNCPAGVSDEVTVTLNPPVSAGVDVLNKCGTSIQLGATPASDGTGNWSFVTKNPNTSGSIADLSKANATLTGVMGGSYELEWTITGGVCNGSMDRVEIAFQPDTDGDTVQDCVDICEGGDDKKTAGDNTGMPDDCDCAPFSAEGEFVIIGSSDLDANSGQNPLEMKADFQLTSDAIVKATPTHPATIFQAGNNIILQSGFYAQAGSDFTARIGPCKEPGVLVEESPSNSARSKDIATLPTTVFDLRVQPNLIHSEATIFLDLSATQDLKLVLYDQTGRLVRTLLNTTQAAGSHQFLLRTDYLASGMYLLQLRSATEVITKKIMVQR